MNARALVNLARAAEAARLAAEMRLAAAGREAERLRAAAVPPPPPEETGDAADLANAARWHEARVAGARQAALRAVDAGVRIAVLRREVALAMARERRAGDLLAALRARQSRGPSSGSSVGIA